MSEIRTNIKEGDMPAMVAILVRKLLRRGVDDSNVVTLTDEELAYQPNCTLGCMVNPETDQLELTYTEE